jgi:4-aminobutyrate aminotransferase/(S)-3-amino-2-methylpropionate transaminase
MPIVITDEQLEEGLAIFEAALEASVQQTVEV